MLSLLIWQIWGGYSLHVTSRHGNWKAKVRLRAIRRFDFRNGGALRTRYDALKYVVKRLLGDSARLRVRFRLD